MKGLNLDAEIVSFCEQGMFGSDYQVLIPIGATQFFPYRFGKLSEANTYGFGMIVVSCSNRVSMS